MQMEERKEQIKETGEIILELPSESVEVLSWECAGNSFTFHRDGIWLYNEDENFPVSEEKVNELLEQFSISLCEVDIIGAVGIRAVLLIGDAVRLRARKLNLRHMVKGRNFIVVDHITI